MGGSEIVSNGVIDIGKRVHVAEIARKQVKRWQEELQCSDWRR